MKLIKYFALNNLLIVSGFNTLYKPTNYLSVKKIKQIYLENNIYFDIYNYNCLQSNSTSILLEQNKLIKYNTLTAEHLFPQSFIKECKYANKDMHNIYLTSSYNNLHRNNYKFMDVNTFNTKYNKNINYLIPIGRNNYKNDLFRIFIPSTCIRGMIARSLVYMGYNYPKLNCYNMLDENLLIKWNNLYPPTKIEIYKNELIKNIQGNYNPYISNYKLL